MRDQRNAERESRQEADEPPEQRSKGRHPAILTGPAARYSPGVERRETAVGLACGAGAFLWWGLAPVYFKAVKQVPSPEILAHRVVWSVLLLFGVIVLMGRGRELRGALSPWREKLPLYALTTALISANWLLFIWAVNNDHLLDASLGYFINPLVNVLLGVLVLRESLNRRQTFAVGLAAVGVLVLVVSAGVVPWISLALAGSFACYGLVRKRARIDAFIGLFVETAVLAPIAIAGLVHLETGGAGTFGHGAGPTLLLLAAGPVTSIPLILFTQGVRRLSLSTIGLVQYLAPTGQFLLAVAFYDEPFTAAHVATFACIWTSLAIYSADAFASYRSATA